MKNITKNILTSAIVTVTLGTGAIAISAFNNAAATTNEQQAQQQYATNQSSYQYSSQAKEDEELQTKTNVAIEEKYKNDNASNVEYTTKSGRVSDFNMQLGGAELPHYGITTPKNTYTKAKNGNNLWMGYVIDYENTETNDQVIQITIEGDNVQAIQEFADWLNSINGQGEIRKNTLESNFNYFMNNVYTPQ